MNMGKCGKILLFRATNDISVILILEYRAIALKNKFSGVFGSWVVKIYVNARYHEVKCP